MKKTDCLSKSIISEQLNSDADEGDSFALPPKRKRASQKTTATAHASSIHTNNTFENLSVKDADDADYTDT